MGVVGGYRRAHAEILERLNQRTSLLGEAFDELCAARDAPYPRSPRHVRPDPARLAALAQTGESAPSSG